jgi:DNA-binding transcriptional MocR family regulator
MGEEDVMVEGDNIVITSGNAAALNKVLKTVYEHNLAVKDISVYDNALLKLFQA